MDHIAKKIDSKVKLCIFNGSKRDAAIHLQSGLELSLLIILGYLWNRNFENISDDARLKFYIEIQRPSIGKIVELSRILDTDGQLFKNTRLKDFRDGINKYPSLRNEKLGHGFSFDDDAASFLDEITSLKNMISQGFNEIFGEEFDFVKVIKEDGDIYKGIIFKPDGDLAPWVMPRAAGILQIECVYIKTRQGMFLISPFIAIDNEQEFFIYSYVEDRLAARSVFNRLVKTGRAYFDTPLLVDYGREIDEFRRRSSNGTVVNNYENNYKKYIETDIAKKVVKFLKANESTVFATLWGHGGVGKTASMQRVCESLLSAEQRIFDYIIFVSAKDRQLNMYTGAIEAIEGSVDSFDQVIGFANRIVFQADSFDPTSLIEFKGRMLLVLDDYETFPSEEKEKFLDFVKSLSIGHHKVVLTTRSASQITGEEIEVLELSENETLEFFDSVLESYLRITAKDYQIGLNLKEFKKVLHELTSGRPLFIFQSAMIYGQGGSISELLDIDLKTRQESIDFLYGRIWDYLSNDARRVFWAMGQMVSDGDLSNVISKLRYILNMEKDEQKFSSAINELVKLKVVKIEDAKVFKVYSSEIAAIMREVRIDVGDAGSITGRLLTVGSDKKLDSDLALLTDADSARVTHKVTEVINKYRHLISRAATRPEIKAKAVVNLAQYLIEDAGDYDHGIRVFEEFNIEYNKSFVFVKAFATYLWRGDEPLKQRANQSVKSALNVIGISIEDELDLLCMLMRYEFTLLVIARQELKDASRLGDIEQEEYDATFAEQRHEFFRIYNYPGLKIFSFVENSALENLDNELKIKCLNGLSYFVDVCIRRKKFDVVGQIFDYVFNNLKYNYHDNLKQKLARIQLSESTHFLAYDDYVKKGSVGDRFNGNQQVNPPNAGRKRSFEVRNRNVSSPFAHKLAAALQRTDSV
ncbi:MAG: hypothetical protein HHJ17_11545 [Rhodoferax sp.]|uniref:NB-ARC domain-containing protein n=1 Tax=Rhodoferax sp. TaxID=50421 RepID=UPI0017E1255C|nr:NB-ARC domain-containing protein [Rhodoferax sp.]NMM14156.1 hypothetical protein [Rhodoferax sp.]